MLFRSNHVGFFARNMAAMRVLTHEFDALEGEYRQKIRSLRQKYSNRCTDILRDLRRFGGGGDEWQLDGYARNAAAMIPTLEASAALADVRFRAATMRLRVGTQDYESFALALRHVPAP